MKIFDSLRTTLGEVTSDYTNSRQNTAVLLLILLASLLLSKHSTSAFASIIETTRPKNPFADDNEEKTCDGRMMTTTEELYRPHIKHAALFGDKFHESWAHPDLIEIVEFFRDLNSPNKTQKATDKAESSRRSRLTIPPTLKEEIPGVYSFRALTSDFVAQFNEELHHFYETAEKYEIPIHRPNSMNNYGVIVNQIGMRGIITDFQQNYLLPLSKQLFPQEGSQFDDHHSFIVRYQADEDAGLDMHTDDSDVTFNVCLGEEGFTGATLTFCGMFGAPDHRKQTHIYHHEIGKAVIHLGSRRHGADDIETGTRFNLIVWNHNFAYRGSPRYGRKRQILYEAEKSKPDPVCLSYTHDRDYTAFKEFPERATKVLGEGHKGWCPPPGAEYPEFEQVMDKGREAKENI